MKQFDCQAVPMGTPAGGYPGAFGHCLVPLLKQLTADASCLHLFSGSSLIGDVRVDNRHENATHKMDVFEYLRSDSNTYDVVLLDPPYEKTSRLTAYAESPISNNVPRRRELTAWLQNHARKVIWLDICAPIFPQFERERVYLVLPGGYRRVRVLSILAWAGQSKETER